MSSIKPLKIEDEYDVWERQPVEDVKHFEAFKYYLTLGHKGKIYEVAEKFKYKTPSLLYHVANNNRWQERRKAWLDHLNKITIEETEKTVKEMARRHASEAMLNASAVMVPVKIFAKRFQSAGAQELEQLPLSILLKYVYESAKIYPGLISAERMARGQATEISKSEMEITSTTVILPTSVPEVDDDEVEEEE